MQSWSDEQAINFEAARECISHLMAILIAEINRLESASPVDEAGVARLETRLSALFAERRSLGLRDEARIEWVRREYGREVREHTTK